MHSVATIINNILYWKFSKRVYLKCSHHIQKKGELVTKCGVMDMLIRLIVMNISPHIRI